MKIKPLFVFLALLIHFQVIGKNDSNKGFLFVENEELKEAIDNLSKRQFFQKSISFSNIESEPRKIPNLTYEIRIAKIDNGSPIKFEFNKQVKDYIDLFTVKRAAEMPMILGLSDLYFPIFDEYLDKHDLPLELKYIAIVESALNPLAKSSSGAVGLWQFKINTAKMLGLTVDSYIDERRDPEKSTEAACKYFEYLYRIFNDWTLAIAAYNGGPGEVRNAIQRSGGKTNYWEIQEFLSEQTRNYIPAFIAATYVMKYHDVHQIEKQKPLFNYDEIDTVHIHKSLDISQITEVLQMSMDHFKVLNPIFKTNHIPVTESDVAIILPKKYIEIFIQKELSLYAMEKEVEDYHIVQTKALETTGKVKLVHEVKKGEIFHEIAIKYGCTVESILYWNKLDSTALFENQKIDIWVFPEIHKELAE